MGIRILSGYDKGLAAYTPTTTRNLCPACAQQPNIHDFKVLRAVEKAPYTLLEIKYGNTTNYEGRKVLIVRIRPVDIMNTRSLDPHFQKDGKIVARFEPTPSGWALAQQVLEMLPP